MALEQAALIRAPRSAFRLSFGTGVVQNKVPFRVALVAPERVRGSPGTILDFKAAEFLTYVNPGLTEAILRILSVSSFVTSPRNGLLRHGVGQK